MLATVVHAASSGEHSTPARNFLAAAESLLKEFNCAFRVSSSTWISSVDGFRAVARRNAYSNLFRSSEPQVRMIREANARLASTNWGSFNKTSACNGVFVRGRRTTQYSRVGASKISMLGGGD